MEIILLERIERLGQLGDIVKVKDGFARNYLLPQKKALRATATNRAHFEAERTALEKENAAKRAGAKTDAERLDGEVCVLLRQASDSGHLYGSVTARDIAAAASKVGVEVSRRQVILLKAIKSLGVHPVRLQLHPEVTSTVQVVVARTDEEAAARRESLARGEQTEGEAKEQSDLAVKEGDTAVGSEEFFEEGAAPAGGPEDSSSEQTSRAD